MRTHNVASSACLSVLLIAAAERSPLALAQPIDPGVRAAPADGKPPQPLPGVTADEREYFQDGLARFMTIEVVSGAGTGEGNGLGPRFNSNQCSSCHLQPVVGGSSPASNPLIGVASAGGASNSVPWFIAPNGPIREARFVQSNGVTDGGVHDLFVISGRADAPGCSIAQPNFLPAGNPLTGQGGNPNVVFRIPTPIMGAGLIESIPDSTIIANMNANAAQKAQLGIGGHVNSVQGGTVNRSANDGTITRFGWKAQNKSLLMFSGEAYNVEMGISNQLFPQERDETPSCQLASAAPNDTSNFSAGPATGVLSDVEAFADFMRLLAPPTPAPPTADTRFGQAVFTSVGCAFCHTPSLTTGTRIASGSSTSPSAALSHQQANLYSDLLVHHMGTALADGITQGAAGPDEFRTAPLWGVGQREYFLHDGRASNLVQAIEAHASQGSEATATVQHFNSLPPQSQQALIDFLRSL